MRWLDPSTMSLLGRLAIKSRRVFTSAAGAGGHRALTRGHSRDFEQHRPYSPGDDTREIDWKVYGRLDRYYVKQFRSETRMPVMILLDCSSSMAYRSEQRAVKFDLARKIAAGLAWIALRQGDEPGLLTLGSMSRLVLPAKAGASQLVAFDDALSSLRPDTSASLADRVCEAGALLRRNGLILLISDLHAETAPMLKALSVLTARRHQLGVVRVLDPFEKNFPFEGPSIVSGLEGTGEIFLDATAAGKAYREALQKQEDAYQTYMRKTSSRYCVVYNDGHWERIIERFLS